MDLEDTEYELEDFEPDEEYKGIRSSGAEIDLTQGREDAL